MGSLDAFFTEETDGVVLEEDLDVLALHDTLLHHLGGTEEGLAHDEIDLLGKSAEVEGILAGGVAAAHDGHGLLAIEEPVAGGTG